MNFLHNRGFQRTPEPLLKTLEIQKKLIDNTEPCIFDVGAHAGGIASLYRKYFPAARIHCFEPFADSFAILSKRFSADPLLSCHNIALSDKPGKALLNVNLSTGTNSFLDTDEMGHVFWGRGMLDTLSRVEVPKTTI
ncbi:MAG: FkbM family methyltransferase, partial [Candidatus Riflebacteria bacterium]|nr:FkbM family methyltransferase [Candidatus Riflebacteria bacterium]